ncbi:hypothetical protein C2I18_24310 [Paenibacillus sp. PK3_47]|uniref:hypothetical protein n=1 Tax=Paenibacillus sp. PK3_47 TaxID=2072642 RepID=UPI00201E0984|nr:hypothetical protein [Paenibacillus sp. PK3_47]UQZ36375.1 hypothetical protein C2I18_24310 [Paenibacillus sp. PK3_47]
MITVVAGAAVFLLLAAGLLAYQNSRLIAEREAAESAVPTGLLMYSIYYEDFAHQEERPEAVPLFQFTVLSAPDEQFASGERGTTMALCRVPAGTGEMTLTDAESWMTGNIRKASVQGTLYNYTSYTDNAMRRGEKELVKSLQTALKEETGYANHYK